MTMPPPLRQPYDRTRGLISCFTHDGLADDQISAATAQNLRGLLVDLYEEAFRRLPVEDMPNNVDTAELVDRGGLSLGLLDPVTNIVLNTVSLLPDGFEATSPSTPSTSGRSRRHRTRDDEWDAVARRSSRCLLEFMRAYFGLLTEEQAGRYLISARADLTMTVLLVEHDLYTARPAPPDPSSGRTRNSLRLAATHVNHPCPDRLVWLATAWLPPERLEILAPILGHKGHRNTLTIHDVNTVLQVLRHQDDISAMTTLLASPMLEELVGTVVEGTTGCADLGDGRIACATIVQRACPSVRSLGMSLYGAIHGALTQLVSPMDPVSNIVLNAVWYEVNFPLPEVDRCTKPHDILDTLAILRAVSRSLRGLLALLHATSGLQLPLHEILKYLCYAQCDLSIMLQPHLQHDESSPNPFLSAATAAKHPQASSMAEFLASLAPTKLDRLRSLMTSATANNTALSSESLMQIHTILKEETPATMIQRPHPHQRRNLSKKAMRILASKREAYDHQQSLIRGRIEHVLQEYTRDHPLEPKYELDFICGMALITGHYDQWYHVNFMATTKSTTFRKTLFFAEFQGSAYHDHTKKFICCPLPQPYDMGRCYYGQESARKIAYPDHSIDYISSSDITRGGLNGMEDTLDVDFLYFDSERDVELSKVLQRMVKQEEARIRSERFDQWHMGPEC